MIKTLKSTEIVVSYVSDWTYISGFKPMPCKTIEIPSDKAKTTGRYKFVNGKMYIEIEEKTWFGLSSKKIWLSEDCFRFDEIEYFECTIEY